MLKLDFLNINFYHFSRLNINSAIILIFILITKFFFIINFLNYPLACILIITIYI